MMLVIGAASAQSQALSGITFAEERNSLFVVATEAAARLGWSIRDGLDGRVLLINARPVTSSTSVKRLNDGTLLLAVGALRHLGAEVSWDIAQGAATVRSGSRSFLAIRGQKRVEVNIATQRLRAWQGNVVVVETRISTGKPGHETPVGQFSAGPIKARRHYSSLYNAAPMPYSVQVNGNIFIHGFDSVPDYPASHGCIRVPLDSGNPARWFYEWVESGTPISIKGQWRG